MCKFPSSVQQNCVRIAILTLAEHFYLDADGLNSNYLRTRFTLNYSSLG